MDSISLMDVYQSKTLIKHLIKSILRRVGQQKQLFYGLSALLKHTCVFFQAAIKVEKNHPYRCGFMLFMRDT